MRSLAGLRPCRCPCPRFRNRSGRIRTAQAPAECLEVTQVHVADVDHVGLGLDYEGAGTMPEPLEDVTGYPYTTEALLNPGCSERDIRKLLGANLLRVLRPAEYVARTLAD